MVKSEETIKLSVVILTYNRKDSLLSQLKSLQIQGQYDKYRIYISDNHSNYDVKEWVESNLPSDFSRIIEVFSWGHNTGHELNASFAFCLPKTDWMWILSDDDLTDPNSLNTIFEDIEKDANKEVCWIKYSISGNFTPNKEYYAKSVEDVFNYYSQVKGNANELVFLCNNVYRLSYLRKYLTNMLVYSDTAMSPELLPLYAIKNDKKLAYFSSKCMTNYENAAGMSWSPIWAFSKFGNMLYTDLTLSRNEINAFKKVQFCGIGKFLSILSRVEDKTLMHEYFKKMFVAHYKLFSLRGMVCLFGYLPLYILGGSKLRSLKQLLRRH